MSTLRLTFVGMCMYAVDEKGMHVLMPKDTHGAGGMGHGHARPGKGPQGPPYAQRHAARLMFDIAHLQPGQPKEVGYSAHVSLAAKRFELPNVGTALNPAMPTEVASVGSSVRPTVLSGSEDVLASRVLLRRGHGRLGDPGVCWQWRGQRRQLTHKVEWVVEQFPDDPFVLELKGIRAGTAGTLPPLYPVGGEIKLWIWHIPVEELPPEAPVPVPLPHGKPAPHFTTFVNLLVNPELEPPLFEANSCSDPGAPAVGGDGDKGAFAYGCLSARP